MISNGKYLNSFKLALLISLVINTQAFAAALEEDDQSSVRHASLGEKAIKSAETIGLGLALGILETGSQAYGGLSKIVSIFSDLPEDESRLDTAMQGCSQLVLSAYRGFKMASMAPEVIDISEREPVVNTVLGEAFPLAIKGPKQHDHIVIVGGGVAGIHMGYILKERGYNNVTILEKSDRIAGKSFTLTRDGIPQEMGTCYTTPGKYGELRRVMKDNPTFEEVGVYTRAFYPSPNSTTSIMMDEWALSAIQENFPYNYLPSMVAEAKILTDFIKYKELYYSIFGEYRPSVPPQPTEENLKKIDKTFKVLLEENDLSSLIPLLSLTNMLQGYGYLEEIPAFYGLWWNSPAMIDGFIANGIDPQKAPGSLLRNGYQKATEILRENADLKVSTNYTIESINREKRIKIAGSIKGEKHDIEADFLILTANLKDALSYIDATEKEREIFESLETSTLISTLYSCDVQPGVNAGQSYISSLRPGAPDELMTQRCGERYLVDDQPLPAGGREYRVGFQYSPNAEEPTDLYKKDLLQKLKDGLKAARVENVVIEEGQQHIWPYFSRFTQEEINKGYPWKILEMQGDHNTWYAGASACFESLHDVHEYNRLLVSQLPDFSGRGLA